MARKRPLRKRHLRKRHQGRGYLGKRHLGKKPMGKTHLRYRRVSAAEAVEPWQRGAHPGRRRPASWLDRSITGSAGSHCSGGLNGGPAFDSVTTALSCIAEQQIVAVVVRIKES
ncbi:unnamed protein product [Boreogadus saida]